MSITLLVTLAMAASEPLPEFDFMGWRPGEPITTTTLVPVRTHCSPHPDSAEAARCVLRGTREKALGTFAGVFIHEIMIDADADQRFTRMELYFHSRQYDQAVEALTAKFGEPCDVQAGTAENAFGGTYSNVVTQYCFAGGNLLAIERAGEVNKSALVYEDRRFAPEKEPVNIDF